MSASMSVCLYVCTYKRTQLYVYIPRRFAGGQKQVTSNDILIKYEPND